jgi:hypothetical protein
MPQPVRNIWLSPQFGTVVHHCPFWKEQLGVEQF